MTVSASDKDADFNDAIQIITSDLVCFGKTSKLKFICLDLYL